MRIETLEQIAAVVFTVPVVWQFLQPNDDDFGDLTKRRK